MGQGVEDRRGWLSGDGADGVEVSGGGERRRGAQHRPFVGGEQLVAPVDRRTQGAVAVVGSGADVEDVQARPEGASERLEAESGDSGRRQLDPERHALEGGADLRDRLPIGGAARAVGTGSDHPLDEQRHRVVGAGGVEREAGYGHDMFERQHQPQTAGGQDVQRRAVAEQPLEPGAGGVLDVLAVVDDQETVTVGERPDERLLARGSRRVGHVRRVGDGIDDHVRLGHLDEIDEHHAVLEPVGDILGCGERQPGLADPSGTSCGDETVRSAAAASSARSAARPMNEVSGIGSDDRRSVDTAAARAWRASARRSGAPSLRSSADTCVSTVRTETNRQSAISSFVRCCCTRARTSASRGVNAPPGVVGNDEATY